MTLDFTIVTEIIAIFVCFLTGTILLSFHRGGKSPRRILAVYFFVIGCGLASIFTFFSGLVKTMPHVFRTAIFFAYIYQPLAYLYVKQHITRGLTARDLVHFIPALFFVVDYLPFFLLPASAKLPVIEAALHDPEKMMAHAEGWLTVPWFHMVFRNAVSIFYWGISVWQLYRLYQVKQAGFFKENLAVLRWLTTFVALQLFFFFPYILMALTGHAQYALTGTVIPVVLTVSVTSLLLFFQPALFYGFDGILFQADPAEERPVHLHGQSAGPETSADQELPIPGPDVPGSGQVRTDARQETEERARPFDVYLNTATNATLEYLKPEEVEKVRQDISAYFTVAQPFLECDYTIHDLAKELGVPLRKVSACINQSEQMNFRDYVNRSRIEYCKAQLQQGAWQNLTLEAISEKCGFNNRNSFTTAFKKFSGTNPSAFIQQLK